MIRTCLVLVERVNVVLLGVVYHIQEHLKIAGIVRVCSILLKKNSL
jgi:hypothetical protein